MHGGDSVSLLWGPGQSNTTLAPLATDSEQRRGDTQHAPKQTERAGDAPEENKKNDEAANRMHKHERYGGVMGALWGRYGALWGVV